MGVSERGLGLGFQVMDPTQASVLFLHFRCSSLPALNPLEAIGAGTSEPGSHFGFCWCFLIIGLRWRVWNNNTTDTAVTSEPMEPTAGLLVSTRKSGHQVLLCRDAIFQSVRSKHRGRYSALFIILPVNWKRIYHENSHSKQLRL